MSAIHIEIRNDIMFDIFNQKIYFHNNQYKIKEYLIPDDYEIKYWNEKSIHIASKKIVPPTEIPIGYDSLQYTCYGLYEVTSKSEDILVNGLSTPDRIKSLYYIDTSLIKEEKFKKLANSFSIPEAMIPDSFWYFPQFRDYPLSLPIENHNSNRNLQNSILYCHQFDLENHSTLINQNQLLAILYQGIVEQKELRDNGFLEHVYTWDNGIFISFLAPPLDNWYFPAKVAENQYVKLGYFAMDENHEIFVYEKLYLDSSQDECLLPIPVIYQKI